MAKKVIKVLLIEHQRLFRLGLSALLAKVRDIRVVADTGHPRLALELAAKTNPDVALLGISFPDTSGLQLLELLHQELPDLHVLMLTMHSSADFVRSALNSGASGYLLKDIDQPELEGAIRAAMEGGTYLSNSLAAQLITSESLLKPLETFGLTPRQLEILELVAKGYSQKEIGYQLRISVKTVEAHRSRLMKRLDLHDIASLVKFAVKKGLIPLE